MTHVRFGCSLLHPMGLLTNIRISDGTPDPDGDIKTEVRIKIRYYRNLYLNRPDPIDILPMTVDTTGRLYHDFIRLIFRFLRGSCFANLKGVVDLILVKVSVMNVAIPLVLSISTLHTNSSFYPFTSTHTDPVSFPRTFSSVLYVS